MNFLYIAKKISALSILGVLLPSLCCGIAPARAARKPAYRITVDDIYQGNIQRGGDGILSYQYLNKKGKPLSPVKAGEKTAPNASKDSVLPSSYDLRKKKAITSIKSQGYSGCCWAFASLKSLESNLIKTKKAPGPIREPSQLVPILPVPDSLRPPLQGRNHLSGKQRQIRI